MRALLFHSFFNIFDILFRTKNCFFHFLEKIFMKMLINLVNPNVSPQLVGTKFPVLLVMARFHVYRFCKNNCHVHHSHLPLHENCNNVSRKEPRFYGANMSRQGHGGSRSQYNEIKWHWNGNKRQTEKRTGTGYKQMLKKVW